MVIDVHAHYMPCSHLAEYRSIFDLRDAKEGVDLYVNDAFVRRISAGMCDLSVQLADMERNGIDQRFLGIFTSYFYYELDQAVAWSRSFNDGILKDIAPYQDRFRVLATLPLYSVEESCRELERVMANPLVAGVQISTNIAGLELDDPALEPFWELASQLKAFVLLHPAYTVASSRFHNYHMHNIIANPLDTTIAAFRMMIGQVMVRHPGVSICLSHAGGYLPFAMARFDFGRRVRPELACMGAQPSELAKKLYYDTVVFDPECLEFSIQRLGAERFVLGSDYPFDMGDPNPVQIVCDARMSETDRQGILSENIQRILGEKGGLR